MTGSLGSAFLTFLSANWEIIVLVLVIVAIAGTAYLLYQYLKTKSYSQAYEQTDSARKHIAASFVNSMTKKKKNVIAQYWSPSLNETLIVYNIPRGTKANLNMEMITDSTRSQRYDLSNFYLSGFNLMVLFSMESNKIFHAEVRYGISATKQIEHIRYKNKLSMQTLPYTLYSSKYETGRIPKGGGDYQVPKDMVD